MRPWIGRYPALRLGAIPMRRPSVPVHAVRNARSTASGSWSITRSSVRAAGSGRRSPCSHSRTAVALRPNRAANASRDRPIRARMAQIGTDLGHLDAVIRQFDPDHDVAAIKPKRARASDVAGRGEMSRFVLGVLREAAEPVTTQEVVRRLMAERGQDDENRHLVSQAMKRVGMALGRQKANGTVRSEQGSGQFVLWELAR